MTAVLSESQVRVPPKRYRVGEIVQFTGLSRQTVHNYTTMGLIREAERTPGGHRLFDERVFFRLKQIADLKPKMNMEQIRDALDDMDVA